VTDLILRLLLTIMKRNGLLGFCHFNTLTVTLRNIFAKKKK